jgi:hypothetical protein
VPWGAWLERRRDGLWPRFYAEVMEETITAVADEARWPEWQRVTAPTLLVRGEHGVLADDEVERC